MKIYLFETKKASASFLKAFSSKHEYKTFIKIIKLLLEYGANVDDQDTYSNTPLLHKAINLENIDFSNTNNAKKV